MPANMRAKRAQPKGSVPPNSSSSAEESYQSNQFTFTWHGLAVKKIFSGSPIGNFYVHIILIS